MKISFIIVLTVLLISFSARSEETVVDFGPLQLAQTYTRDIHLKDFFISEKLDGIRARWTGTSLVTRNGHKIHAPAWFTNHWPDTVMDGELWTARGEFERVASIVLSEAPDKRWHDVTMMLFDLPQSTVPFQQRVEIMNTLVDEAHTTTLATIHQFTLDSTKALAARLDAVTAAGGEGLMLHHRQSLYQNGRSGALLKMKRHKDDEARVISYIEGKGKFSGMMGSMLVETRAGLQFKIGSGFSRNERLSPPPIGSWVTFKYYGLTKKGIPRFASFLHVRPALDLPPG